MTSNKLKAGDKIVSYKYGSYRNIYTIERITNKLAYSSGLRFKIDVTENGYVTQYGGGEYGAAHYLLTEELKSKLKKP